MPVWSNKSVNTLIAIAILLVLSAPSLAGEINFETTGNGYIYRVIDGDTVIASGLSNPAFEVLAQRVKPKYVNREYRSIRIRIDGINTAESGTGSGDEATRFLKNRAEKEDVQIRCYDIGYYGRALCNVMLVGNNEDIGALMINTGRSAYFTKYGGVPYSGIDSLYRRLDAGR